MTTFTWPLLARNVPFKRSSSSSPSHGSSGHGVVVGGGEGGNNNSTTEAADITVAAAAATSAAVPSLSHEVCHRLLKERFLKGTSYVDAEESPEGLGRALKALDVLLENEDDVLEVIGCLCVWCRLCRLLVFLLSMLGSSLPPLLLVPSIGTC